MLTLAIVAVGWFFAESALEKAVLSPEELAKITPEQVVIESPPAFLSADAPELAELQQIAANALAETGPNKPISHEALQSVSQTVITHPWVAAVNQIERRKGELRIAATFRTPIALIEDAQGKFDLTDSAGVVLRHGYELADAKAMRHSHGLAVILKTRKPSPGLGGQWKLSAVQQAIALHQYLQQNWSLAEQVVAIDLRPIEDEAVDWRDEPRLKLRTSFEDAYAGVMWGSAPGKERPLESPADLKLKWLTTNALSYQGQIDGHGQCFAVDKGQFQRVQYTSGG